VRRLLAAALAVACVGAVPAGAAHDPSRLQVTAKEYYFSLSRRSIARGPAIVELVNYGEDPHDLRFRRVGGTYLYRTPIVQPGQYYDLTVKLAPGTYRLWCGIANHRQLGMTATIVVRS